jgi:inner membrane protein
MDNLTHTLVGAAIGRAALARRTSLGMAALMIGANLPDVDVLGIPFGLNLGFRRGITHGLPALVIWPLLLSGMLLLWSRWRGGRQPGRPAPIASQLLLLSAVGVLSHPVLDWFNSYGLRWLMPIRGTWFYGDTWFIIDPWVLGVLGFALWAGRGTSRRPAIPAPARLALVLVTGYAVAMWVGSVVGRRIVRAELEALGFAEPRQLMVTPVVINPLVRQVVVDDGTTYHRGTIRLGGRLQLAASEALTIGMGELDLDLDAVRADPGGRQFLVWSRFPFARIREEGDTTIAVLDDARYYGTGASFARTEIRIPPRR